jgi:hypothetical protein
VLQILSSIEAIQDGVTTAQSNYTYIHVARLPLHLLSKNADYSREQILQFVAHTNYIKTEVSYSDTYLPNDVNNV